MNDPIIQTKRIYDEPRKEDGLRVLVDRLWPRGVRKEDARIDVWAKTLAPSTELRKWFAHDPDKFAEFSAKYQAELALVDRAEFTETFADHATVTLLYAAKSETCNHATVLRDFLTPLTAS